MNIVIANRQRMRKINLRLLKKIANALLAELEIEKAEIGICLVAAPEMTRLNETFLKHKGSTDVITFDYRDSVGQASSLSHLRSESQSTGRMPALRFTAKFLCAWMRRFCRRASSARAGSRKSSATWSTGFCICSALMIRARAPGAK